MNIKNNEGPGIEPC